MAHANFIESGETVTARPSIPITGKEVIPEEIIYIIHSPHRQP